MPAGAGTVGLVERVEDHLLLAGGDADAGVGDLETQAHRTVPVVRGRTAQRDAALGGEFQCVADEDGQDLEQAILVARQHQIERIRHRGRQRKALGPRLIGEQRPDIVDQRGQMERRAVQLQRAGLDARQVEHVGDQPQQRARGLRRGIQIALLKRRTGSVSRISSIMPTMPFSGVRISWLMLARNRVFVASELSAR